MQVSGYINLISLQFDLIQQCSDIVVDALTKLTPRAARGNFQTTHAIHGHIFRSIHLVWSSHFAFSQYFSNMMENHVRDHRLQCSHRAYFLQHGQYWFGNGYRTAANAHYSLHTEENKSLSPLCRITAVAFRLQVQLPVPALFKCFEVSSCSRCVVPPSSILDGWVDMLSPQERGCPAHPGVAPSVPAGHCVQGPVSNYH
jgi:hypothetical protein